MKTSYLVEILIDTEIDYESTEGNVEIIRIISDCEEAMKKVDGVLDARNGTILNTFNT